MSYSFIKDFFNTFVNTHLSDMRPFSNNQKYLEFPVPKINLQMKIKTFITIALLCLAYDTPCRGAGEMSDSTLLGTLFNSTMFRSHSSDSIVLARHKKTFFHRVGDVFTKLFREFNTTDENYIESQHYNYTVMLQNTNTYERYTLSNKDGQSISFAPDVTYRLGPYVGWRWVFLGYAIDLKNIGFGSSHSPKKGFSLSLYSSLLGVDLFWRQTGNDYHIKRLYLGDGIDTTPVRGVDFDGLKSSVKGFNLYYIFNHRRFSYPAAYAQSTVQRRSAGSWLAGIGYTQHTLEVDWEKLEQVVVDKMGEEFGGNIDNKLRFGRVKYTDVSGSCGYAYNWVFAKDFLFNASLSMALAYNQSLGDVEREESKKTREFSFRNFNLDGIGRFALVWNNTHWYAGSSIILHTYNYKKDRFSTNNSFGELNLYVGVNLGRKR